MHIQVKVLDTPTLNRCKAVRGFTPGDLIPAPCSPKSNDVLFYNGFYSVLCLRFLPELNQDR